MNSRFPAAISGEISAEGDLQRITHWQAGNKTLLFITFMVLKGSLGLFGQLGLGDRSGAALGLTHLDVLEETHSPLPQPFLSPFLYKILSYRHKQKHTGTFLYRIHFHLRFLFQFAFSWLASGGQDSSHFLMPLFLIRMFFPLMQTASKESDC